MRKHFKCRREVDFPVSLYVCQQRRGTRDEVSTHRNETTSSYRPHQTHQSHICVCLVCAGVPTLGCLVIKAVHGRGAKSDLPRDADLSGWPWADGERQRAVACRAVWVREERGHVGDGGQQHRAGLGAFVVGQRDDHVVLVPHMEGVVGKWVHWRRMAGGRVLRVVVLFLLFIAGRTQHTF